MNERKVQSVTVTCSNIVSYLQVQCDFFCPQCLLSAIDKKFIIR